MQADSTPGALFTFPRRIVGALSQRCKPFRLVLCRACDRSIAYFGTNPANSRVKIGIRKG
uniref:Uncharacterized protein n=1 Tax=Physcomitrium patens TaxID=3218 RepID=A0A2K1IRF7_PHYPA|nr:hypothetical protein PHYPA_025983 [Physcomitrium patens]